ncbi:hypothetical protein ACFOHO_03720 [Rhizorhabdus histidinilytica]|uniref:hypothetical protein n=1 Tax=Rhizorhabdus histidinilytica TaxID=439228 RepID=UPI003606EE1C
MLEQAGRLELDHLAEAFLVELHRQAARKRRRDAAQIFGVAVLLRTDRRQEAVEASAVERGLVEVLAGADEFARSTAHRIGDRPGCAACGGDQEQHELACALGHDEVELAVLLLLLPGFGGPNPVLGRRIGRTLEEGRHQQEAGALVLREIGTDHQPVALGETRHPVDRQGDLAATDADAEARTRQVEGCRIGGVQRQGRERGTRQRHDRDSPQQAGRKGLRHHAAF